MLWGGPSRRYRNKASLGRRLTHSWGGGQALYREPEYPGTDSRRPTPTRINQSHHRDLKDIYYYFFLEGGGGLYKGLKPITRKGR